MSIYEYDKEKTMRMFREEATQNGIHAVIMICKKNNIPSDDIIQSLMTNFQLSESEAQEYLHQYIKQNP